MIRYTVKKFTSYYPVSSEASDISNNFTINNITTANKKLFPAPKTPLKTIIRSSVWRHRKLLNTWTKNSCRNHWTSMTRLTIHKIVLSTARNHFRTLFSACFKPQHCKQPNVINALYLPCIKVIGTRDLVLSSFSERNILAHAQSALAWSCLERLKSEKDHIITTLKPCIIIDRVPTKVYTASTEMFSSTFGIKKRHIVIKKKFFWNSIFLYGNFLAVVLLKVRIKFTNLGINLLEFTQEWNL